MAAKRRKTTSGNGAVSPATASVETQKEDSPFSKPWEDSDAVLIVEEKKLHVHSNILSFFSPVFKSMFNSGFRESKTKTVDMKDKNYDDVVNLLKMIYPQHGIDLWQATISELQVMMTLIEEYMIKSLRKRIEDHTLYIANIKILNGGYTGVCALDLMLLADMFDFNDTIDQCARYIGARHYYGDFTQESISFESDDDEAEESPNMKEFFLVHKLSDKAKLKIMVNIGRKHLDFIEEEREDMYKEYSRVVKDYNRKTREHFFMKSEPSRRKFEDLKSVMNDMISLIK